MVGVSDTYDILHEQTRNEKPEKCIRLTVEYFEKENFFFLLSAMHAERRASKKIFQMWTELALPYIFLTKMSHMDVHTTTMPPAVRRLFVKWK